MKIVIKDAIVIAIHSDSQEITLSMYPEADNIKKIISGVSVEVGDIDPTIAHPEYEVLMKLFLHTSEKIRIVNEPNEFTCSPEDFLTLEPGYPPLPSGMVSRYWTPERNYVSDGVSQFDEPDFDGSGYCDNVTTYLVTMPTIYAHVTLSKNDLQVDTDPADSITFSASIKATTNPEDPSLPVTQAWFIRLRHENGLAFDSFKADFVNGDVSKIYVHRQDLPLGVWYLDENDFEGVTVGETTYQVKLVNPVQFTIWRELS